MYEGLINDLFNAADLQFSNIKPHEWAEINRMMTSEVSPRPGKFSYLYTPYLREPANCISQDIACRIIAIMKGAQIGFSTGVIETGFGYVVSQDPGNILFLTGHADLAEEAVTGKIDNLIYNSGIAHLIKPNTQKARNTRSGDTNKKKEFSGGFAIFGSATNHKLLRQRSMKIGFIDDFDAAKMADKSSGSTRKMIEQRFAAYNTGKKIYYISTPELKETSNIEPVYLMGDQRRYHIPCPCCDELIYLDWEVPMQNKENEMGGITWKLDENNKLIKNSVGYICYKCGGFFDDKKKMEWLQEEGYGGRAKWIPTAEPVSEEYRSYHVSALYAPVGMDDWAHYVQWYIEANPINQPQKEEEMKAFTNLCLGYTWETKGEMPKANQLQSNTRNYDPGVIPEKLSIKDGNGRIVLLTLGIDLNGKVEDARADYEVVAWAENGVSYSVQQGSIGTFIPKQQDIGEVDRDIWTYEKGKPRSVWPEIDKLVDKVWEMDTGRKMKVFIAGVDAPGHFAKWAYDYVEKSKPHVFAIKGKDTENKITRMGLDVPLTKPSRSHPKLHLIEVNLVKDMLADNMKLKHKLGSEGPQPIGFMNFPLPTGGMYTYSGFFSQFESEHRILDKGKDDIAKGWIWVKRNSVVQNHFWDCRVYNIALKDMWIQSIGRERKEKNFTWEDYVSLFKGEI